ncbi:ABC transporter permease [Halopseudomonas sp. Lyrl_26]|uniref:ABC transporter permease n=1 Tax=Halopseudomonas sp. Lyrl_26 TaxID=3110923 RepID=UPI003F8178A4
MQFHSISPAALLASLWQHAGLIRVSARREVLGRYQGSLLGLFWTFFTPLFMLAIYTFVFSVVFNARWGADTDSKAEFALLLFAGLIVFNIFSECITRAPGLVVGNVNYVKKVVYPLEILPFVILLSALFHGSIGFAVWVLAYIALFGAPHWTVLYLPLILLPFLFLVMGLSWALAALGVYLRDITQFVTVITSMLMFLSPIFYPLSALPENFQQIVLINPLAIIIEMVRGALYFGQSPDFRMLAGYWLVALLCAWLGFALFQKTRKGFADVL